MIVIDNGSTDGSEEDIRSRYSWVTFLQNGENLGYAEGNNRGIRRALADSADYIFILNNDTKVFSDCISRLVSAAENNSSFGIFGPLAFDYDDETKVLESGFKLEWHPVKRYPFTPFEGDEILTQNAEIFSVDVVQGDAFFVRRKVFEYVGLFDPQFFLMHEESDLCIRAKKYGVKIGIVKSAKFQRMISGTFGRGSNLSQYYAYRNILLLIRKNTQGKERRQRFFNQFRKLKWDLWDHCMMNFFKTKDVSYLRKAKPMILGCLDYFLGRFGRLERSNGI